jgi:transketolase
MFHNAPQDFSDLPRKANALRRQVLELCYSQGGHISTSYSCMEILVALYHGGVLRVDPRDPTLPGRDRFILSKGHAETVLYAVLSDCGFFPAEWLEQSNRRGICRLGGHVDAKVPGVELSTGALGHGLGVGCGLALGAHLDDADWATFVMLGDAECSEGSVWEAALFAAQHGLGNLVAVIDRNFIGSLDYTRNYLALEPFADKWRAFGWDVIMVEDGHDIAALRVALPSERPRRGERPLAIIVNTVKGKGVSFFENDPVWHVRPVTADLIDRAREELEWKA